MAKLENIYFEHVGKNEGCTCDKCGQYIRNIWTVRYKGGLVVHYGKDCFDKLMKDSKLTKCGVKLMHKTMQSIKHYQELLDTEKELTEEIDVAYQAAQEEPESCWYGEPWEEYHEWRITELWPERIRMAQKDLDRFSKVNFIEG